MGRPDRLRPMGIGDMIDESWKLYRRHFRYLLMVAALFTVPSLILVFFTPVGTPLFGVAVAQMLLSLALTAWEYASMIQAAGRLYLTDERTPYPELLRSSLRRLPALFAGGFLCYVGVVFGVLLFVIPAFWLAFRWSQYPAVAVLEKRGGYRSLGRSRTLTKGRFWFVVGFEFVIGMIFFVYCGIFITVISLLSSLDFGVLIGLYTGQLEPVLTILFMLVSLLSSPFYFSSQAVLYYQLRIRQEGLDLELAADQVLGDHSKPALSGM